MNKTNKGIIIVLILMAISLCGLWVSQIITFFNNNDVEQEQYTHYPYEDITLVLSEDWKITNTKPQGIIFERDTNTSFIDNLMIYTYNSFFITDFDEILNSYSIYLNATNCKIINKKQDILINNKLGDGSWIKYIKNNIMTEIFFIKNNDTIYSIISSHIFDENQTIVINSTDMSSEFYNIVKRIY